MRRRLLWTALAALVGCGVPPPEEGGVLGTAHRAATDGTVDVTVSSALDALDVAWGDVDRDGDLDLAVAVDGAPDLVMLSGPTGLTTVWSSPNSEDTTGVALGDMDGDGLLDLVTTGDNEPLRVYAGDGAGGFSQYWTDSRTNRQGRDLALGDLDGDGDLDIAQAVNSGVDRTWINGGTSFVAGPSLGPNRDSEGVAVGDMDGDGDVDVVVARSDGDSRVYLNLAGSFSSGWSDPQGDGARHVALGDLDGDGALDFVLARDGGNRLWMGNGSGGFTLGGTQPSSNTWAVALADHDGDGVLDLVAGNDAEDEVFDGSALTATATWDSASIGTTYAGAWGDADGDGAPELLAAEYGSTLTQYANAGLRPHAAWSSSAQPSAQGGALGDLDGDGDLDLVLAIDGVDAVWSNDGTGTFSALSSAPLSEDSRDAALGDLDGDGDLDVALAVVGAGARVLLNDGAGGLSLGWSANVGATGASVELGDLDGDGNLDLALGCDGAPNEVWLGDGAGGFVSGWTSGTVDATTSVTWGDLNGDGHLDLFVGNEAEVNRAWLGDGSTLMLAWSATDTVDTQAVALADMDGDGDLDAVVANEADPDQIWLNDGQGSFALGWSASSPSSSTGVAAADLDGDGDIDLAFTHTGGPTHFAINEGGSLTEMDGVAIGVGSAALAGDVDGDGDADVVTVSDGSPVTVFRSAAGGSDRMPDGPTRAVLAHPTAPGSAPGGGPVITGSIVTVPFTLIDRESDPATVELQFAPLGAADWTAATTSGATTNLATSPAGVSHTLDWHVATDGVAGERVAVRLVVPTQVPRRVGGPLTVGATGVISAGWRIAECVPADADGDGSPCSADCDDLVPTVFPGAPEVPDDGVDQDCDGNDTVTCWFDGDLDGYGGLTTVAESDGDCDEPDRVAVPGDCDDGDPFVSPDGVEVPDDGIDQDCSGSDAITCQVDGDGDTFGGAGTTVAADGDCVDPGEAPFNDDCDDAAPSVYPGAPETCDGIDQDCDGDLVEGFVDTNGDGQPNCFDDDDDGDGFVDGADCGPLDASVFPGAPEVCDGIDQDCDGDLLETFPDLNGNGVPDCIDTDFDGDGFSNDDCDDSDGTVYPGAPEIVGDGIDQDCNGADSVACFVDLDGDGVGSGGLVAADGDCDDVGEASVAGDCDDGDPAAFPGAPELVDDGVDQDCNGADTILCAADLDGDGFGGAGDVLAPDGDCDDLGEATAGGDCDDSLASVSPAGVEIADDGVDQDCNGADTVTCFQDLDGDGVGGLSTVLSPDGDCTDPLESSSSADCDDGDPAIFPGATDVPDDGVDQDCSGTDAVTCQVDNDGDGVGGLGTVVGYDGDCADPGESSQTGDCNDASPTTYPGAPEVCDGVDQDCDGDLVESFLDTDTDGSPDCFDEDDDGDGVADVADCGSLNAAIYPGAPEVCDGIDQDCDGDLVEGFADANGNGLPDCAEVDSDGDGFAADDCDDTNAGVYPGAPEVADDGVDQDCNGADTVTCFLDADGDGVGSTLTLSVDGECDDVGEAYGGGDCDDSAPLTFPGAPEIPDDGVDQDCSGTDAVLCFEDGDGDGYGGSDTLVSLDGDCTDAGEALLGADCDDEDATLNPGASEVCDGVDQDCDGDLVESFLDADGDGLPDCAETEDDDGDGYVGNDCDDGDASIFPGAPEIPEDGVDQDCNGYDAVWCSPDQDGDGFGDADTALVELSGECGGNQYPEGDDCDDDDVAVNPGADEVCNGVDDDCDGVHFPEEDTDGDGDGAVACADCDDADPTAFPDAEEECADGVDNDCDGADDAFDPDCNGLIDQDGDGVCPDGIDRSEPLDGDCDDEGEALDPDELGDCDDMDPDVFPGQVDACDGVDQDCGGLGDEVDGDGDGQMGCEGDCDDGARSVFLGATETCGDGIDQDCDGSENAQHDDPECWPTRWTCATAGSGGGVSPWLLVLGLWPLWRRRRSAGGRSLGPLLGLGLLLPAAAAGGELDETLGLVQRAVERGQCAEALDQVRLLREEHGESLPVLGAHADAARCAGRAREAVNALRALQAAGGGDDSTDVLILTLQRSLGVVEVRADVSALRSAPLVRLEIRDGDAPELIEGEEVGAGLWRFSDLPADTPLALVVSGEGIRRLKEVLRPLGPGELLRHQLAPEWGGFGMLALARDLQGVEVLVEEGRQRIPLSSEPVQVTAGRVPVVIIGSGGSVETYTDVPAGEAGAIFDPLPWLPGSLDLLHVPAGSRVRVVVEDPEGRPRARSFPVPTTEGAMDRTTGLRVVERVTVDSLPGGEAGVFVIHPVLGNHVSSMLLAPGEENTVQVAWREMEGVERLQARWEEWNVERRALRQRIAQPLIPAGVATLMGSIGAGVLGGLAVARRNEAEGFQAAAIAATETGNAAALSQAWQGYSEAHAAAEGLRVGAVVSGVVGGVGLGLTIAFTGRGLALQSAMEPWDPWENETSQSP